MSSETNSSLITKIQCCPKCNTRVVPTASGRCPACNADPEDGSSVERLQRAPGTVRIGVTILNIALLLSLISYFVLVIVQVLGVLAETTKLGIKIDEILWTVVTTVIIAIIGSLVTLLIWTYVYSKLRHGKKWALFVVTGQIALGLLLAIGLIVFNAISWSISDSRLHMAIMTMSAILVASLQCVGLIALWKNQSRQWFWRNET